MCASLRLVRVHGATFWAVSRSSAACLPSTLSRLIAYSSVLSGASKRTTSGRSRRFLGMSAEWGLPHRTTIRSAFRQCRILPAADGPSVSGHGSCLGWTPPYQAHASHVQRIQGQNTPSPACQPQEQRPLGSRTAEFRTLRCWEVRAGSAEALVTWRHTELATTAPNLDGRI